MTGGTLVVKKGSTFAMTKVANDGYDLEDHIATLKAFASSASKPEDVTTEYLRLRKVTGLGDGDFDPYDPLNGDADLCRVVRSYDDPLGFDEALELMEQELMNLTEDTEEYDEEHPYNQLACSYCDYVAFIDMDESTALLNDEDR
jgi:hypothetical protein